MGVTCAYHPEVDAVGACVHCGRLVCIQCKVELEGKIHCNSCIEKMFLDKAEVEASEPEVAVTTVESTAGLQESDPRADVATPKKPSGARAGKPEVDVTAAENTSGQGKSAVVPQEVRGWNWGAFLLTWIWGIGNRVWLAFLVFLPIPLAAFAMSIVLGVKGSEWAWQSRKWDSVERFKRTQRTWMYWGIGILCLSLLLTVVAVAIALIGGLTLGGYRIEWG